MKSLMFALLVVGSLTMRGQSYNFAPKLSPVWARLGDANGENGDVESVEFSPDGRYIVSGTKYDNAVVMWRVSDGNEIWRYETGAEIEKAAFSPDGQNVAVAGEDYIVRLLSAETGTLLKEIPLDRGIDGLAYSHKGDWLVAGEEQNGKTGTGQVRFIKMPEAQVVRSEFHEATVNCVDFTFDDHYLLVLGGATVAIWDMQSVSRTVELKSTAGGLLITARFSPDGKYVAAADDGGNVQLWNWREKKLVKKFNNSGMKIEIVDFDPGGRYLLTGGFDNFLRVYLVEDIIEDNKYLSPASMHDMGSFIEYLDFSQNGELLCTANQDGTLRLWVFMKNDENEADRRHRALKKKQKDFQSE